MAQTVPQSDSASLAPPKRKHRGLEMIEVVRNAIRTSPWLTIAIAVHVLVGAVMGIVHYTDEKKAESTAVVTASIAARAEEEAPLEETPALIDRAAIPENVEAELVPHDAEQFQTDVPLENQDLSLDAGDPNATGDTSSGTPDGTPGTTGGTAIGIGSSGFRGLGTPSAYSGRQSGTGIGNGGTGKHGRATGPSQATEEAILNGMIWLARHQDDDGGWTGANCLLHCPEGQMCQPQTGIDGVFSSLGDVGVTSLALLSYLGAGYGHDAKQTLVDTVNKRRITIGKDIVQKGLKWLVDRQQPDGSFTGNGNYFLYNEAIATLALSEAYGLTQNKFWKGPAQKAIDFICRAQKPNPTKVGGKWGWRYTPGPVLGSGELPDLLMTDADMSVTGWMVMALKSAQLSRLKVPEGAIEGALEFAKFCSAKDNSGFVGYRDGASAGGDVQGERYADFAYHLGTMSSIGMCVRIFLEHDQSDPFLLQAADVLVKDLPTVHEAIDGSKGSKSGVDYYYWYYGSLALNQFDGPDAPIHTNRHWVPWNKAMQETVLKLQDQTPKACSKGGWMIPDRWAYGYGPVYTTAINVLNLEVYYRYANAFGTKPEHKSASSGDSKAPAAAPAAEPAPAASPADKDEPK